MTDTVMTVSLRKKKKAESQEIISQFSPISFTYKNSKKNYKLGFISFHSATGGTIPSSTISSRILQRCS